MQTADSSGASQATADTGPSCGPRDPDPPRDLPATPHPHTHALSTTGSCHRGGNRIYPGNTLGCKKTSDTCGRPWAYRCLLVDGLDDKLLVVERDVPDLTPREADLWGQPEVKGQRLAVPADGGCADPASVLLGPGRVTPSTHRPRRPMQEGGGLKAQEPQSSPSSFSAGASPWL